jgi:hypothetical protein
LRPSHFEVGFARSYRSRLPGSIEGLHSPKYLQRGGNASKMPGHLALVVRKVYFTLRWSLAWRGRWIKIAAVGCSPHCLQLAGRRWRSAFLQPLIIIAARRFLNVTFEYSPLCGVSAALLALEAPRTTTAAAKEQSASIRLFHLLPDGRISFPASPLTVLHCT